MKHTKYVVIMEKITLEKIYSVLKNVTSSSAKFDRKIQLLCESLLSIGFHSVRYYEAVNDHFSVEKTQFVLTHAAYHNQPENSVVGISIGLNDTTLITSSSEENGVARGQIADATDKQKETWIKNLNINDTNWIDLEIRSNDTQVGLLAMSWTGSKNLISKQDEYGFRLIREIIGNLYTSSFSADDDFDNLIEDYIESVSEINFNSAVSLDNLTKCVADIIPSDTVAAFMFDWIKGKVIKASEAGSEKLNNYEKIEETYVLGDMLTGKAFVEEKYRFIPNFGNFIDKTSSSVEAKSLEHHQSIFGKLKSVAYFPIGTKTNRILIRCFRGDNFHPAFTDRDYSVIKEVSDVGTSTYDFNLLDRQKSAVQEAAIDGLKSFTDSNKIFDIIGNEIKNLKCESYIFAHFSKVATSANFIQGSRDIKDARNIFGNKAIESWELLQKLPINERRFEVTSSDFLKLGSEHTYNVMQKNNWHAFGCIRISAEETSTIVFIPLESLHEKNWIPFDKRLEANEIEHLSSLISIFGASLEAKNSHISAENADDLLANIGHELQTPITEIEQSAIDACERCHQLIDNIENSIETKEDDFNGHRENINIEIENVTKKAELLRHFMDVPRTMSEFFGGDSMPVSFRKCSWKNLVNDSWDSAYSWATEMSEHYSEYAGRASFGLIKLKKNDALERMSCVMSEPLIKMALTNLLKNAIKFSLPRYDRSMTIEVKAIPQTGWNIIQITNWGIGIKKEQFEEIFGKYHRIDRIDAKRDIAGRGLGLYLARAMVRAQGGYLFCESSVWTLDDTSKRDEGVGYLTTFELRIPNNINPGSRKVKLQ